MTAKLIGFSLSAVLLFALACNRSQPERQAPAENLYRVKSSPSLPPQTLVHKTFKLPTYAKFAFEVPAHSLSPRLQGTFKAYPSANPEAESAIDVLLLNEEQFDDFAHGRQGEASYSIPATSGQSVDYQLPATLDAPAKYYLVFQNPAPNRGVPWVKAEFTTSF